MQSVTCSGSTYECCGQTLDKCVRYTHDTLVISDYAFVLTKIFLRENIVGTVFSLSVTLLVQ